MSDPITRHRAPAKLNLGLEITGRRPDGYHELVTIFQTIGLYDDVTIAPAAAGTLALVADPTLGGEGNLILRAARALAEYASDPVGAALTLTKGIPVAAGLGGGSSDAAITLLALRERWGLPLDDAALARIAARLGADVPFFLRGGTALATGIGERLVDLPALTESWFVIVTPALDLPPDKTRRLYAALTPADFGDGARTHAQAERLRAGLPLDPALLVNSFAAPLERLFPPLADWRERILHAGAPFVLPSGSGPTLYTLVGSAAAGQAICVRLGGAKAHVAVVPAIGQEVVRNTTR
jgi:4-diphosphocytidyl-2-C-methyl-D-erythritol kinase